MDTLTFKYGSLIDKATSEIQADENSGIPQMPASNKAALSTCTCTYYLHFHLCSWYLLVHVITPGNISHFQEYSNNSHGVDMIQVDCPKQ